MMKSVPRCCVTMVSSSQPGSIKVANQLFWGNKKLARSNLPYFDLTQDHIRGIRLNADFQRKNILISLSCS